MELPNTDQFIFRDSLLKKMIFNFNVTVFTRTISLESINFEENLANITESS